MTSAWNARISALPSFPAPVARHSTSQETSPPYNACAASASRNRSATAPITSWPARRSTIVFRNFDTGGTLPG